MALVPKVFREDISDLEDITSNLDSLRFESVLTPEEEEILYLRKRSHALTLHACAQATYFISVLNEARLIKGHLHNPLNRRASRLLHNPSSQDSLKIGIIGCGRLGSHLAQCFLTYGEVNPECIKISTRRPETLVELQEKGVVCMCNNLEVAKSVHVLFLCILPSKLAEVAQELRGQSSISCVMYSFISSTSMGRHKQLLEYSNIIKPEFTCDMKNSDNPWDYSADITGLFAKSDVVEQTCPLSFHKDDALVTTCIEFAVHMVYGFVNMCSFARLSRPEIIDILNVVLLGHSEKNPLDEKLVEADIGAKGSKNVQTFPRFDLVAMVGKETPLTEKLVNNSYLRKKFVERYCDLFAQFAEWAGLIPSRKKFSAVVKSPTKTPEQMEGKQRAILD